MRQLSLVVLLVLACAGTVAWADDLCAIPAPLLGDATLIVRGFTTPTGDDGFRLRATLGAPADVDPARDGFAFHMSGFFGPIAETIIPGGAGWRWRARGWQRSPQPGEPNLACS